MINTLIRYIGTVRMSLVIPHNTRQRRQYKSYNYTYRRC